MNEQFLWRPAFNKNGARIANVGSIEEGDIILVAWRHSGGVRTAYLRCRVAAPLSPREPGLVIDKLTGPGAEILIFAGYSKNATGEVEGIRLDEVLECCFQVKGKYGGNNTIHELAPEDVAQLPTASTIPPEVLAKPLEGMPRSVSRLAARTPLVWIVSRLRRRLTIEPSMLTPWSIGHQAHPLRRATTRSGSPPALGLAEPSPQALRRTSRHGSMQ